MSQFREQELDGKVQIVGEYIGGGGEIHVRIVQGGAYLGSSGLLIGGDTHSSQSFITDHSVPLISSLIVVPHC